MLQALIPRHNYNKNLYNIREPDKNHSDSPLLTSTPIEREHSYLLTPRVLGYIKEFSQGISNNRDATFLINKVVAWDTKTYDRSYFIFRKHEGENVTQHQHCLNQTVIGK